MPDANVISDLVKNPQGKAAKRIARVGEDRICTGIIVVAELRYGCAKSVDGQRKVCASTDVADETATNGTSTRMATRTRPNVTRDMTVHFGMAPTYLKSSPNRSSWCSFP